MLALAVSVALPSTFTVSLSEGKQLNVINDLSNPFLAAHELQVNVFLGSGGEGVIRMSSEVAGIHGLLNPGPIVGWHVDQLKYEISVHELVGIAVSPQPRVYIVNGIPPRLIFKSKDADAAHEETSKPSVFNHLDWTAILSQDDGHAHFCRDLPKEAWKKEIRGDAKKVVIIRDTDWF